MPRPKNESLKAQIVAAAEQQFGKAGYNATSYTSIAKACGISRNLVQYHFPKKELLALAYMERTLAHCMKSLNLSEELLENDFEAIKKVGIRFFETLLSKPGTRAFLSDIISSRELTESVLAFNYEWAMSRITIPKEVEKEKVLRTVIVRMGGFYELLFWCVNNGKHFDVEEEIGIVVDAFKGALEH